MSENCSPISSLAGALVTWPVSPSRDLLLAIGLSWGDSRLGLTWTEEAGLCHTTPGPDLLLSLPEELPASRPPACLPASRSSRCRR